ncbi:MAG: hypothetical protein Q8O42_22065 [Acidobacteriota bacterium]|nr:hypothetical protein [Acidobacteriota bacterium]
MKILATAALAGVVALAQAADESWLRWDAARAQAIGKAAYVQGRVGGIFDTRLLKTERSYNYKLAATWLNGDVIRATARTLQLTGRLSDDDARKLVNEASAVGDTVVMVEIDPREGSGVIPTDWAAFLQPATPKGVEARAVRGTNRPELREIKALAGVMRRNYDYDRFWVVFSLRHDDGKPLFGPGDAEAELVVRIADREGRVKWPIPASITR